MVKDVPFSSPSGPLVGRMRYAPIIGYVRPFKKLSRFRPLRGRLWGVFNTPLQSGTCCPSKNYLVSVPFGAACGAYAIRPYNRVRAALQKTISFPSPSGPSVGRIQYAPTIGYVLPFEKLSRFRPLRGRLWGVCDTPL